jgi:hypothetical protein
MKGNVVGRIWTLPPKSVGQTCQCAIATLQIKLRTAWRRGRALPYRRQYQDAPSVVICSDEVTVVCASTPHVVPSSWIETPPAEKEPQDLFASKLAACPPLISVLSAACLWIFIFCH